MDYHENDLADIFPELTLAERRKICRVHVHGNVFCQDRSVHGEHS